MNELPTIEKFIFKKLTEDLIIGSFLNVPMAQIHANRIPQGSDFPAILFSFLAGSDVQGLGTNRLMARPLMQIKAIGRGQIDADLAEIADRIDELFQNIASEIFENMTISARREQILSYEEPGGETDLVFRHIGGIYRFEIG